MNDFGPLYQSIVKNLLQARADDIKLKACHIAVESLEQKYPSIITMKPYHPGQLVVHRLPKLSAAGTSEEEEPADSFAGGTFNEFD
jgi:hypothetical protein